MGAESSAHLQTAGRSSCTAVSVFPRLLLVELRPTTPHSPSLLLNKPVSSEEEIVLVGEGDGVAGFQGLGGPRAR
jgi:hypothetical protein